MVYATAVQKVRAGLVADARLMIDLGLRLAPAPESEMRRKLETLRASLPVVK